MLVHTEKQLETLGVRLAKQTANSKWQIARRPKAIYHSPYAVVLALEGELGSGKTTFMRGFAKGLSIRSRITSPTFILARRHRISRKKLEIRNWKLEILPKWLWHLDLYRLRDTRDLHGIGFFDILRDPRNIAVIEWADRARRAIPKNAIWISFRHHPEGRTVRISHKLN